MKAQYNGTFIRRNRMEQKSLIDTKANFVHFFLEHPIDEVYVVGVRL